MSVCQILVVVLNDSNKTPQDTSNPILKEEKQKNTHTSKSLVLGALLMNDLNLTKTIVCDLKVQ